ncbi:beta-L-arabinofuranosidase domain-containing protein [Xanthomonas sp. XNM01]|uniref:glycoside hydrolase family 127 protein n=1 Tax=Xanthomonas sp. XNM01 TaxID=2769289 RepID=UPI0017810656|nr:beta-L-arabinofuranosidase domain-containing protein [Xanthomonas sp. XNM01]MBD9370575.1 glycoside hydrolase family 127 protein [Xanthomonas sp. XNM01]
MRAVLVCGQQLVAPASVRLDGPFGQMLAANRSGRLSHFIVDEHSPSIGIFGQAHKQQNQEGDWYGEHAGKWLSATARAVAQGGQSQLEANLRRVADWLISQQDDDGYLGTYAAERRFTVPQPPKPESWNGEPALRTWDIWTHSYLILGLLETWRALGGAQYLQAARRIGDLCWRALQSGIDITTLGNHHGMSATVLLDPAADLYLVTGEPRYLALAETILQQANANPRLALLDKGIANEDAAFIATGKAYQLSWNLVGLAKLYKATGRAEYKLAVDNLWNNIREQHLTLGGGPWGGVAHRSREVFNAPRTFFPQAYVETCSVLAWMQLNRELLAITGHARHADALERSGYNDLAAAMAPDGEDWCYYTYPNGRRVHTTYWRCCKSSGAMAVEELPPVAYGIAADGGLRVNLYGAGEATLPQADAGAVRLVQSGRYPFDGDVVIDVHPQREARFAVGLRIPDWAASARITVAGVAVEAVPGEDGFVAIERLWRAGDRIVLSLPMPPVLHRAANINVQESRAPDGSPVAQEVLRWEYVALSRGPLVYATPLVDGYKTDETLRLPAAPVADWVGVGADAGEGATLEMRPLGRAPIMFEPYYRCGGRVDGAWRLTWLSLAPEQV